MRHAYFSSPVTQSRMRTQALRRATPAVLALHISNSPVASQAYLYVGIGSSVPAPTVCVLGARYGGWPERQLAAAASSRLVCRDKTWNTIQLRIPIPTSSDVSSPPHCPDTSSRATDVKVQVGCGYDTYGPFSLCLFYFYSAPNGFVCVSPPSVFAQPNKWQRTGPRSHTSRLSE